MARELAHWRLATGWTVRVLATEVVDGDLAVGGPAGALSRRREALRPGPWTWLCQVHGDRVVEVDIPGACAGSEADAAITTTAGATLSVQVADCAPVAIAAPGGLAVVHAGWRGLEAGVLVRAAERLRTVAPGPQVAVVGPCIRPCCYEFGAEDLDRLAALLGDGVRGLTLDAQPALDVPAAVIASLADAGVDEVAFDGACTGCDERHWSHRVGGSASRQALVAWAEAS